MSNIKVGPKALDQVQVFAQQKAQAFNHMIEKLF